MQRWSRASTTAPAVLVLTLGAFGTGCGADLAPLDPSDVEVGADAVAASGPDSLGAPSRFDRSTILADELFEATGAVDAEIVQQFLEATPYGDASWLAAETVAGRRAADAIVEAAVGARLNPLLLLTRMQVEQSLISKTDRPRQAEVDYAFGCGCPDGAACSEAYRGLDRQLGCAADTLRRWFDASIDGSGLWRKGVWRRSSDGLAVRPTNHATASLYAYTPWVLQGSGGNWLVWNVTRRFVSHLADEGLFLFPVGDGAPALELAWSQAPSGRHSFELEAPEAVASVELRVDGNLLGGAERGDDGAFPPISVGFTIHRPGRVLEARGFDASGAVVAFAVGSIDTTSGTGVFVRPIAPRRFEIGLDRAPADVAGVQVKVDGELVSDAVSGTAFSQRLAVDATFARLGVREIAVELFAADGTSRGVLRRTMRLR